MPNDATAWSRPRLTPKCRRCGVILDANNWPESRRVGSHYLCRAYHHDGTRPYELMRAPPAHCSFTPAASELANVKPYLHPADIETESLRSRLNDRGADLLIVQDRVCGVPRTIFALAAHMRRYNAA